MSEKALTKYKISTVTLIAVSVVLNIFQNPIYNYLILSGKESFSNAPLQTMQEMSNLASLKPLPIVTFSTCMFVVEAALFVLYILGKHNKYISKAFCAAIAVNIISRIYSVFNLIKLIVAYSNYNADMEWVKPIISQYTTNVLISMAYLAAFVFLFIDALKKHKFLKASRIVMLVIAARSLFAVIMNFVNYNVLYALVSGYGFFFTLALLIYYFRIAENKNKITLESELYRLKAEYENGNITDEEYTTAKQNILNNL